MAYGFETRDFSQFERAVSDHPNGIPEDRARLERLSKLYIAAAEALFQLMFLIMRARLQSSPSGARYMSFLQIYRDRVDALIALLNDFLLGGLERGEIRAVADFLEGVRHGAIAQEMLALENAIDASSGAGEDAESDEAAGTTVTNSLKEQIERRVGGKWVKDILHAINEVLSVVRGVA